MNLNVRMQVWNRMYTHVQGQVREHTSGPPRLKVTVQMREHIRSGVWDGIYAPIQVQLQEMIREAK